MWNFIASLAAPLISGGIGAAGQNSTNIANARMARETNVFNAAEAEKNRDFQAGQAATTYQRKVADLRAAGLNPAMAFEGPGAPSVSGSTASGVTARFDNSAGAGVNSAVAASNMAATLAQADKTKAETNRINVLTAAELADMQARARLSNSSAARNDVEQSKTANSFGAFMANLQAEWQRNVSSARESDARTRLTDTHTDLMKYDFSRAQAESDFYKGIFGKNVAPYLNSAGSISRLFAPYMLRFGR